jgi:serine/threonine protein kinase
LVSADQWARVCRELPADATDEQFLAALANLPAAWDESGCEPTLTPWQLKQLRSGLAHHGLERTVSQLHVKSYVLRSILGRGGMGVVYQAWDTQRQRLVALKRVRQTTPDLLRRFHREARLLAKFDHANIARFLAVERTGKHVLLIMEYVPGVTLQEQVNQSTTGLPWPQAVRWARATLAALEHAHSRRVVHRDIKPANLMLTPDAKGKLSIKLLDMGLAKCIDPTDESAGALTRDGQALGTLEYMPPEQWKDGSNVTPAADLYALGGTLYFALTGQAPFVRSNTLQYMNAHLYAAVPSVRALRLDVPIALDALIQRMLAKDPAKRGTARELRNQLSRLLSNPAEATALPTAKPARLAKDTAALRAAQISTAGPTRRQQTPPPEGFFSDTPLDHLSKFLDSIHTEPDPLRRGLWLGATWLVAVIVLGVMLGGLVWLLGLR